MGRGSRLSPALPERRKIKTCTQSSVCSVEGMVEGLYYGILSQLAIQVLLLLA